MKMTMTTFRLVGLRLYAVTLGRTSWGAALLRRCLLKKFVHSKSPQDRYTASSRFFDVRELE